MTSAEGLAASRGFASGPVFLYAGGLELAVPEHRIPPEKAQTEIARYAAARAETRRQIDALRTGLHDHEEEARIFANHLVILDDPEIVSSVELFITDGHLNAEAAIRRAVSQWRDLFARMNDPYLRERIRDIDDVERRCLRVLLGKTDSSLERIDRPVVIIADDLTPSDTVALPRANLLGIATNRGSATSHVALLARALGVPAIVGLGDITERVHAGDTVLLDGDKGIVIVNPDADARVAFEARLSGACKAGNEDASGIAVLADGEPITLCANAQPGVPLDTLVSVGVQGVGLYRSEYLWLAGDGFPTEDAQVAAYTQAIDAVSKIGPEARVVFRVLDIGGDKLVKGISRQEANPFLGNRSLRYLLSNRDVFRMQLRAILKASARGHAAVMFPMVATLEELREANAELRRAMDQLRMAGIAFDPRLPHGTMIEIPSAALNAVQLARETDFFSIGTNDLVQYTLAADRGNEQVAYLQQPAHPAVLKLIDSTVQAARHARIPVSVCGESASDPTLGLVYLALGVTSLSMSPGYVRDMKRALARFTRADLDTLAEGVRTRFDEVDAREMLDFVRTFAAGHA